MVCWAVVQNIAKRNYLHKAWTKEPVITRYWNRDDNSPSNMLKGVLYMKKNKGTRPA